MSAFLSESERATCRVGFEVFDSKLQAFFSGLDVGLKRGGKSAECILLSF